MIYSYHLTMLLWKRSLNKFHYVFSSSNNYYPNHSVFSYFHIFSILLTLIVIGVDVCHAEMIKQGSDNFLACKEPLDGMWRCYTEGKYGQSIRDAPDYTKQSEKKFYDCLFREATGLDVCMGHFSDMVRNIYRQPDHELCDFYWK